MDVQDVRLSRRRCCLVASCQLSLGFSGLGLRVEGLGLGWGLHDVGEPKPMEDSKLPPSTAQLSPKP